MGCCRDPVPHAQISKGKVMLVEFVLVILEGGA